MATNPSGVDIVKNEVLKCAGVRDFPYTRVAGRRQGHPECCTLLSQTGVDHIFEIIDRVLLGFKLEGVEGHGDITERLVNEEADVQFEPDGGKMGNLIQGLERLTDVSPCSGIKLVKGSGTRSPGDEIIVDTGHK